MLKLNYFIGCILVASVLLSCSKSDSYDIKADAEVKFFTNNTGPGNAPENSINYNAVNIPDAAGSGLLNLSSTLPGTIKFPVLATKPVSQDVTIGAALDNTLIDAYNASHNTSYIAFPAGILNTDGLVAHILKDATISADSITIVPDLNNLKALTEKAYMAPIKLTTVSDPGVGKISDNSITQVVYIVANIELRRIKYQAVAADALGSLVTPRTSWVATFNPAPSINGNIFDGSNSTYARWAEASGLLDVNMQTSQNVTGIRLYHGSSATYTPTSIEVSLSNDGINYDLIGFPLKANLTFASGYNYILFYKAIPAQYIRLRLNYSTSTNSQNRRVAEFDVYAN